MPLLDPWQPLEPEVVEAMLDLAQPVAGEKHVDLGAGDGRIVAAATARGLMSYGIELDPALVAAAQALGRDVRQGDALLVNLRAIDIVTAWFTVPGTVQLVAGLQRRLKPGARLIFLYDSRRSWRPDTGWVEHGIPEGTWQPVAFRWVINNKILRYEVT